MFSINGNKNQWKNNAPSIDFVLREIINIFAGQGKKNVEPENLPGELTFLKNRTKKIDAAKKSQCITA